MRVGLLACRLKELTGRWVRAFGIRLVYRGILVGFVHVGVVDRRRRNAGTVVLRAQDSRCTMRCTGVDMNITTRRTVN
jgi:hypothetical protein